jgi:hypothetical protein
VVQGAPSTTTSSVECAEGTVLLGGGFELVAAGGGSPSAEDDVESSQPTATGQGWEATVKQLTGTTEIIAYAICTVSPAQPG